MVGYLPTVLAPCLQQLVNMGIIRTQNFVPSNGRITSTAFSLIISFFSAPVHVETVWAIFQRHRVPMQRNVAYKGVMPPQAHPPPPVVHHRPLALFGSQRELEDRVTKFMDEYLSKTMEEHDRLPPRDTAPAMRFTLRHYQLQGLHWLVERERDSTPAKLPPFGSIKQKDGSGRALS